MADYGNYSQPPLSARRYETQLQNPATVAVGGALSTAAGFTAMNVGQELLADAIFKKGDEVGSFTHTAKSNLLGQGIKTDAQALFKTGNETKFLNKTGIVLENSGQLIQKSGGVVGNFTKELLKTPTGKSMAAWTAVATVFGGIVHANAAQKRNENLVSRLETENEVLLQASGRPRLHKNTQGRGFTPDGRQYVAKLAEPGQLDPRDSVDISSMLES